MVLTDAELRVMGALQAKVDGLLGRARKKAEPIESAADWLGWTDDIPAWVPIPGVSLLKVVKEFAGNDAERQVAGALRMVEDQVGNWMAPSGQFYRWAQRGTRDDGTPYPAQRWLDLGNEFASALSLVLDEFHQAATFTVVQNTAEATADDIKAAVREVADTVTPEWDWKTKAALMLLGACVVAGGAAVVLQAAKNTPVGLGLRGAKLVAGAGVRRAGAAFKEAVERGEKKRGGTNTLKPRQARSGGSRAAPVVVNVQLAAPGRGGKA